MSLKNSIINILPNPLSRQSNLSVLQKKSEILAEGMSFTLLIRSVLTICAFGFLATMYFRIGFYLVVLFVAIEIIRILVLAYVKIRKIRILSSIETEETASSYRDVLITSELYGLLQNFIGLMFRLFSVGIVIVFFLDEFFSFVSEHTSIPPDIFKYLLLAFLFFSLSNLIPRTLRYYWIRNLIQSDDLAEVNKDYQLIEKRYELLDFLVAAVIILPALVLMGIPSIIIVIVGIVFVLVLILSIIELQRIKGISFNSENLITQDVRKRPQEYQREKIEYSLFGVLKVASSFRYVFKPYGKSVLGSGRRYYPENTIILTNYRILLTQVPVTGGDKIVGEVDYVSQNFFFNRAEIKEKGEALLRTNSLAQILNFVTREVLFRDIKEVRLKKMKIFIELLTGETLCYTFFDKEHIKSVKDGFYRVLGEKFKVISL